MNSDNNYNNSNEILFWKVFHNKFIFQYIFKQIEKGELYYSNYKKYHALNRIKFKDITSFNFLLKNNLTTLLKYKLSNDYDYIKFDKDSIENFFQSTKYNSLPIMETQTDYFRILKAKIDELEYKNKNTNKTISTESSNCNNKEFKEILKLIMDRRRLDFELTDLVELAIKCENIDALEVLLSENNKYQLQITPKQFESILFPIAVTKKEEIGCMRQFYMKKKKQKNKPQEININLIKFIINLPESSSPLSHYSFYPNFIDPINIEQDSNKRIKTSTETSTTINFKELSKVVLIENKFQENRISNYNFYLSKYQEPIIEFKDDDSLDEILIYCFSNFNIKTLDFLISENYFNKNISTTSITTTEKYEEFINSFSYTCFDISRSNPDIVLDFLELYLKSVKQHQFTNNYIEIDYYNIAFGILIKSSNNFSSIIIGDGGFKTTDINNCNPQYYYKLLNILPIEEITKLKLPKQWKPILPSIFKLIHGNKIKGNIEFKYIIKDNPTIDWLLESYTNNNSEDINKLFLKKDSSNLIQFKSKEISDYAYTVLCLEKNDDGKTQEIYNSKISKILDDKDDQEISGEDEGGEDSEEKQEDKIYEHLQSIKEMSNEELVRLFIGFYNNIGDLELLGDNSDFETIKSYRSVNSYFQQIINRNDIDYSEIKFNANKKKLSSLELLKSLFYKDFNNSLSNGIKLLVENGALEITESDLNFNIIQELWLGRYPLYPTGNQFLISIDVNKICKEIKYWLNQLNNNGGNNTYFYTILIRYLYLTLLSIQDILYCDIFDIYKLLKESFVLDDDDNEGTLSLISYKYLCIRSCKFVKFIMAIPDIQYINMFCFSPIVTLIEQQQQQQQQQVQEVEINVGQPPHANQVPVIRKYDIKKYLNSNSFSFEFIFSSNFEEILNKLKQELIFKPMEELASLNGFRDFFTRSLNSILSYDLDIRRTDLFFNDLEFIKSKLDKCRIENRTIGTFPTTRSFKISDTGPLNERKLVIKTFEFSISVINKFCIVIVVDDEILQFIDFNHPKIQFHNSILNEAIKLNNTTIISYILNNYKGNIKIINDIWFRIFSENNYQVAKLILSKSIRQDCYDHYNQPSSIIAKQLYYTKQSIFNASFINGNIKICDLIIESYKDDNDSYNFIIDNKLVLGVKGQSNIHIIKYYYQKGLINKHQVIYLNDNNIHYKGDIIHYNWFKTIKSYH